MSSRDDLLTTLGGLLEEEMGEPFPHLEEDRDLREGLGLDSVDVVGLVMRIEREFHIRLSMEDLAPVKTVGAMLDLLQAKLAETQNVTRDVPISTDGQAAA